jgi:hypothetical protein
MQRGLAVGPKGDVAKQGHNLDLLGDGNLPVVSVRRLCESFESVIGGG